MKSKKTLKICIIFLAAVAVLLLAMKITELFLRGEKVGFTEKTESVYYFPEDYGADIMSESLYLAADRTLYYTENGLTLQVTAENKNTFSESTRFFLQYFDTLINGDYETHKTLFSLEFFKAYTVPAKFTKQRIYNISVSMYDREYDDNEKAYLEKYVVTYKIMKNDGTYRADIASNEAAPVMVELIVDTEIKINKILPVKNKEE